MTGEQYWNVRGRGFGGEPDGENTTSCAEENVQGYPGTRYFGSSSCVHEFSHGIMRGAVYTVDPEYRKAVEDAYAAAKRGAVADAIRSYEAALRLNPQVTDPERRAHAAATRTLADVRAK
jgi:hypothetical protein